MLCSRTRPQIEAGASLLCYFMFKLGRLMRVQEVEVISAWVTNHNVPHFNLQPISKSNLLCYFIIKIKRMKGPKLRRFESFHSLFYLASVVKKDIFNTRAKNQGLFSLSSFFYYCQSSLPILFAHRASLCRYHL